MSVARAFFSAQRTCSSAAASNSADGIIITGYGLSPPTKAFPFGQ
jgi:hypothetical protein